MKLPVLNFALGTVLCLAVPAPGTEYESVTIRVGSQADDVELNVAHLLARRIAEPGGIQTRVEQAPTSASKKPLVILLGIPAHHDEMRLQFETHRIPLLSDHDPGPEGFLVKTLTSGDNVLIAAAHDQRGVLYAAGEVLRRLVIKEQTVELPHALSVRTAPAFEVRGTQFGQSGVAKRLGKVRDWTPKETRRVIIDYALAGANVFPTSPGSTFDFIKSFGLMTQGGFGANTGSGPSEWTAKESIGRIGYVCLSVPEAHAAHFPLR